MSDLNPPQLAPAPAPDSDPWDRQPGETARAFAAFGVYRDLGPFRSIRQTARTLGKDVSYLSTFSAQHDWQERAALWDAHLAKVKTQQIVAASVLLGQYWVDARTDLMRSDVRSAKRLRRQADRLERYVNRRLGAVLDADGVRGSDPGQSPVRTDLMGGHREPIVPHENTGDEAQRVKIYATILKEAAATHEKASALSWAAVNAGINDWAAERHNAQAAQEGTTRPEGTEPRDNHH